MRFRRAHEINFAIVSGVVVRKDLRTRRNGKKCVTFSLKNTQVDRWGNEMVEFVSIIFCMVYGELGRAAWLNMNPGDRVFVQGRISWKATREGRLDYDSIPYGVQVLLCEEITIASNANPLRVADHQRDAAPNVEVNYTTPHPPQKPDVPIGSFPPRNVGG